MLQLWLLWGTPGALPWSECFGLHVANPFQEKTWADISLLPMPYFSQVLSPEGTSINFQHVIRCECSHHWGPDEGMCHRVPLPHRLDQPLKHPKTQDYKDNWLFPLEAEIRQFRTHWSTVTGCLQRKMHCGETIFHIPPWTCHLNCIRKFFITFNGEKSNLPTFLPTRILTPSSEREIGSRNQNSMFTNSSIKPT